MRDAIDKWIKGGCNYQAGVGLYEKYGSNPVYLRMFQGGDKAFNRQKLNQALTQLRDACPPAKPIEVKQKPKAAAADPAAAPVAADIPELLKVTQQRDANYAELRGLHALLHSMEEGENLRQLAVRIITLGKKNAELWTRYNHITEHGEDPVQPRPVIPTVMVDINLLNARENIRKSLSKAQKRYAAQTVRKPATLALINKQKQALKDIDLQIAQLKAGGSNEK